MSFKATGLCGSCVHRTGTYTCDAWPDGIPREVMLGELDHREPIEGDGGVQYQEGRPRRLS